MKTKPKRIKNLKTSSRLFIEIRHAMEQAKKLAKRKHKTYTAEELIKIL